MVADRASGNLGAFEKRYLCCFAHQIDNSFKFAMQSMKRRSSSGALITSLNAIKQLAKYCNQFESKIVKFSYTNSQGSEVFVHIKNPAATRWLGILDQAMKVLKVKDSIIHKAEECPEMFEITSNLDWSVIAVWIKACSSIHKALKYAQRTNKPNLHLVLPHIAKIIIENVKYTDSYEEYDEDIVM